MKGLKRPTLTIMWLIFVSWCSYWCSWLIMIWTDHHETWINWKKKLSVITWTNHWLRIFIFLLSWYKNLTMDHLGRSRFLRCWHHDVNTPWRYHCLTLTLVQLPARFGYEHTFACIIWSPTVKPKRMLDILKIRWVLLLLLLLLLLSLYCLFFWGPVSSTKISVL